MSKIIYHIPWKIKEGRKSATGVRPLEMLQAFKDLGYEVDVVWGSSKDRQEAINEIKAKINSGTTYDFIYSESSVAPTFIASGWRDYVKYGSIDFKFLKYCRKKGIKLTLFYRDMYWKFEPHTNDSSLLKRLIMQIGYRLDLLWYKRWVNIFYLPSTLMTKYLGKYSFIADDLPPGGVIGDDEPQTQPTDKPINLFYVGGATGGYKLHKLFSVVSKLDYINLRFCTREKEWNSVKDEYQLASNIQVVHKSGKELEEEYDICDIALLYFQFDEYRSFSMPVKMFEYASKLKPIIATQGTAAGNWVEENSAGWVIPYSEDALLELFTRLAENPNEIDTIKRELVRVRDNNLWITRAKKVASDIRGLNVK